MNVFLTTFEAVAALLGIGFVGFWIIRQKILPETMLGVLSVLALDIALPSLVFATIITTFSPSRDPHWWQLPLWWLAFTGLAAGMTAVARYLSPLSVRREFSAALFYQNGIFFPLAIITGMFGAESVYLTHLFLFTLFYAAFFFTTMPLFFGKMREIRWRKIVNPVLAATLLAIALRLTGAHDYVPDFLVDSVSLLGAMTVPLLMLILGGTMYMDLQARDRFHWVQMATFAATKNLLFPALFLLVIVVLRPPFEIALILLLESAVPPVTAVPLMVSRMGGNRAVANQFMIASFLASLATIPLMVYLFSQYYPLS